MIYMYDKDRNLIGKFNLQKATKIAGSKSDRDNSCSVIYRTASKNYVISHMSMRQDEVNTFNPISPDEIIECMEVWDYPEGDIRAEFPEYREKETY